MIGNRCKKFENLTVYYSGFSGMIEICRCCLKRDWDNVIARISLDEYLKIPDKYQFLASFVNVWPENFNRSTSPLCGGEKECFYTENDLQLKSLEIGLDMHCNLSCSFCGVKKEKEVAAQKDKMKLLKQAYFDTLESLRGHRLEELRLTDRGEPLFFKNEIKDFIKSTSNLDVGCLSFTTNGTLIDDELIDIIQNSNIQIAVGVSLNAWDRESYKEIMGVDAFEKVVDNIKKLSNKCFVSVSFVYRNSLELSQQKKFFKSHLLNFANKAVYMLDCGI